MLKCKRAWNDMLASTAYFHHYEHLAIKLQAIPLAGTVSLPKMFQVLYRHYMEKHIDIARLPYNTAVVASRKLALSSMIELCADASIAMGLTTPVTRNN